MNASGFHPLIALLLLGAAACSEDVGFPGDAATGGGGASPAARELGPAAGLPECPPDTGVEPPHTDLTGTYSVPVPPDLEPYASYPIDSVTACLRDGLFELGYKLPELLVGDSQRVSFRGSYDAVIDAMVLSGDGTATCQVTDGSWSCFEEFAGIEVDLEAVAEETAALPAAEAAARVDVATRFGVDPIGIVDFAP